MKQRDHTSAPIRAQLAGEDDFAYFSARPEARTRIRAAFDGEFPREILRLDRDGAGDPTTRARSLFFAEGGRA